MKFLILAIAVVFFYLIFKNIKPTGSTQEWDQDWYDKMNH